LLILSEKSPLATVSIPTCRAGVIAAHGLKYGKSDKFAALYTPKRPWGGKQGRGGERGSAPRGDANICGHLRCVPRSTRRKENKQTFEGK